MASNIVLNKTYEDEEVVEETTKQSTEDRCDDGDVCEVSVSVCPDFLAVAEACSSDTGTEITRRVQAVCSLCSESGSESDNQPEKDHSVHTGRRRVVVGIAESENKTKKNGSCEEFGEEARHIGHVGLSGSEEERTSRVFAAKRSDARTTLVFVDEVIVVRLDEDGAEESAKELTDCVTRYFSPRETTEYSLKRRRISDSSLQSRLVQLTNVIVTAGLM